MLSEREQQIAPIVQESVIHNTKILTNLHNTTASLFGIGAGILGLESYLGFLFYILFTLVVSALVYVFRVRGEATTKKFFMGRYEFWAGGLIEGAAGFVLTWTLFYGIVRA